jgi:hypothetical protein
MGVLGTVACHTEGCEGLGVEILSRSKWRDPGDPLCAACEAVREERLRIHWQKHDKRREAEVARIAAEDAEMAAILEDAGVDEELQDRLFEYLCRRHDEQNRGAGGEL